MFGFGFGEIVLLLIIGIVVVGPRNLPTLMRTVGQWIAKIRRMTTELRTESGIDEIIRNEGLEKDLAELRALTRGGVIDTLVKPAPAPAAAKAALAPTGAAAAASARVIATQPKPAPPKTTREPALDREYPVVGCDAYGALADDAAPAGPPNRSGLSSSSSSQSRPAGVKPAAAPPASARPSADASADRAGASGPASDAKPAAQAAPAPAVASDAMPLVQAAAAPVASAKAAGEP